MPPETLPIRAQLCALAESYRLGREAAANRALADLVPAIAAQLRFLPAERGGEFAAAFRDALAAQERGDWIGIADALEYRVGPLLSTREGP